MIVQRLIWVVREGHSIEEAVALTKEFRGGPKVTRQLCSTWLSGKYQRIVGEFEFKDTNTLETEWNNWASSPGAAAWNERWFAVCEATSLVNEIWRVPE